jgi:hypothetical protein
MPPESPESNAVISFERQRSNLTPHPGRRPDLATLTDVRRESAKIYREVRSGDLDSQEGSRLVYMLSTVGKLIEASETQVRLETLERIVGRRR